MKKHSLSSHWKGCWLLILLFVFVIAVATSIWFYSERIGRNDLLQREAKFLLASKRIWERSGKRVDAELPAYTVGNRSGTVIVIGKVIEADGQKYTAELGWTNSILGSGTLVVTTSNKFLWLGPEGNPKVLNMPDFGRISAWWYLLNP